MAADAVLEPDSPNPCSAELMKRYLKMEEKRNALRKAVKLLENGTNKPMNENLHLKKAYEEEQLCGKQEKEAKEKESSIRNKLEKEIHDLKTEISSYQKSECLKSVDEDENQLLKARILEGQEEIKRLKELLEKEIKKADSEMRKAESGKKKAAEAWKIVKMEKNKAEEERRQAEIERKKAEECRLCLEKVTIKANEMKEKLNAELSKADDARKKVEAERQKTNREKKRADSESIKAEEQKRLTEIERKKAVDEKVHADMLSQKLEEENRRSEELQKKIEEIVSTAKRRCGSCIGGERCYGGASFESANIKLLREQLKLEKKQSKHAKKIAKLEKAEKSSIMQELHLLKHNFMQILCCFNMLDNHLSHSIRGTDSVAKIGKSSELQGFKLHEKLLGSKTGNRNSGVDFGLIETCCTVSFSYTEPTRECVGLPLSRGSFTRPTTGIISELESPIGGSVRNKSQSYAVCSSDTSFSDKKSLGSQERDSIAVTTSVKLAKNSKQRPNVLKLPSEVAMTWKDKNTGVVAKKAYKSFRQREVENTCLMHDAVDVADRVFDLSSKKRKFEDTVEPVAWLYTEDNQLLFKIGEKLSAVKDLLNIEDSIPAEICSRSHGISKDLDNGTGLPIENHDELCRRNYSPSRTALSNEQQTPGFRAFGQNDNQKQADKHYIESNRDPCLLTETAPSSHQVRENFCTEQVVNSRTNERADLICFENMICGNYMKLLYLDNDVEEQRYRKAVELPLSPTSPDIELHNIQLYGEEDSHYLIERDSSMPFYSFDVMDLEISSNNSNLNPSTATWDLLSRNNRDFLHATKVGSNCSITLHSDVNQRDMLHHIEHNPLIGISGSLDVEQTYRIRKSNDDMNSIEMVPSNMDIERLHQQAELFDDCLLDPNAFLSSKACGDEVSGETDKMLLSGSTTGSFSNSTIHSHLSHEDGCSQSCTKEIYNSVRNTSSVVDGQNELLGHSQVTSSGLIENRKEAEGSVPHGTVFPQNVSQMLDPEIRKFMIRDKNLFSAGKAKHNGIHQPLESITKREASKQTSLSNSLNMDDSSRGNGEVELERTPICCIVFSNTEDKDSISRILCSTNTFTHQHFMDYQIDRMVVEVCNALAMETVLLPGEKASVFFSLLLCNISGRMPANFKCTVSGDFLPCLESFVMEISRVISEGETKSLFEEVCRLDILVCLIEDFLIERKVLMYIHSLCEPLCCNDISSKIFQLEGGSMCVFSRAATADQFVAGCVILASICAAVDHIGFLQEASYRVLRMCRNDVFWILLAMHVFAAVCGQKLFNLNRHSSLLTAIRSMVSLLERGHESASSISPCLYSAIGMGLRFPPCEQCPFGTGAVCMDELINLLLDVIQDYDLTGVGHSNANKSITFSVCTVPACTDRDEERTDSRCESDCLSNDCDASCCVFKFRKLAADDCFSGRDFCHFTDIISLVELVGCYMSWEWIYNKIMPRLTKIFESCESEEFSAALFVLIGQLGRFGIDDGGYRQKGIAELRCTLSMFLDTTITRKRSFSTQLAAVGALLNLLHLSFGVIVDEYQELTLDTSQSDCAKHIKQWFSQLSRQQQSLSLNLFGQTDFQKKIMCFGR